MTTVGSHEAKTNLAKLLDEVERGKTVTISPTVARRTPGAGVPGRRRPVAVSAAVREARLGVRRGRTPVRRMIAEGRR